MKKSKNDKTSVMYFVELRTDSILNVSSVQT